MKKRIKPEPGQESVWDYPRPPKLEATSHHIRVVFNGIIIVETSNSYRVLETSHPPVYYFPPTDIKQEFIHKSKARQTSCEFKGIATYWDVKTTTKESLMAAWSFPLTSR